MHNWKVLMNIAKRQIISQTIPPIIELGSVISQMDTPFLKMLNFSTICNSINLKMLFYLYQTYDWNNEAKDGEFFVVFPAKFQAARHFLHNVLFSWLYAARIESKKKQVDVLPRTLCCLVRRKECPRSSSTGHRVYLAKAKMKQLKISLNGKKLPWDAVQYMRTETHGSCPDSIVWCHQWM